MAGGRLPIASAFHIPVLEAQPGVANILQPWLCRTAAVAGNRSTVWGKGGAPSKLSVPELTMCGQPSDRNEDRDLVGRGSSRLRVFEVNDPFTV